MTDSTDAESSNTDSSNTADGSERPTTDVVSEDPPKNSRSKSARLFLRDVLFIILAAILISFLVKTFLIRSFYIPSESMETTLLVNDRIIVNELVPELIPLSRGDVVVFSDSAGWLPATDEPDQNPVEKAVDTVLGVIGVTAPDSEEHLIKRVIGLPGDHITCCNDFGQISVNGVPLDESYIELPEGETDAAPDSFDVTVPAGHLWVMGDNRYHSGDSLFHNSQGDDGEGFVPIEDVVGRAVLISWPASRWTWLDNYPVTFRGVDDASD
jgi:signal peptidase I